jgi:4-alpha-glucanotransferase
MSNLEKLATKLGFLPSYTNCFGQDVDYSPEAMTALVNSLGFDTSSDKVMAEAISQLDMEAWLNVLPKTIVVDAKQPQDVIFSTAEPVRSVSWRCDCENGGLFSGTEEPTALVPLQTNTIDGQIYQKYRLRLHQLPMGYHQLTVSINDVDYDCHLIVTPRRCYSPEDAGVDRVWGLAAQLYSLHSDTTWGIGDFGCLYELVKQARLNKMSAIGLNPLHPLYPSNPAHRSPYSPTSRCYLNTIYIDVEAVPGYDKARELRTWMATDEFKTEYQRLRDSELIDYPGVGALKFRALRMLFDELADDFLDPGTEWGKDFQAFRDQEQQDLVQLSTYDALYEHFVQQGMYGWFDWPEEYHDPHSIAVAKFQADHKPDIDYYAWLQWLADKQLARVTSFAQDEGMAIGLYLDLAVGCDGGGAEVWSNQAAYLAGAAVGAPPDAMNVLGQDWGLTPINPRVLKEQAYEPMAKALRCSMKYAGALRIDHILGFMRQYWVAPGMQADEGIYIRFPMDELFRIIALESHRNKCVVIGEDLGTVPEGFDKIMDEAGLLSYKVLFFERWESGLYKRPELYPRQSMATVSTHDLHTLAGWWTGNDLQWRQHLNLYPNQEMAREEQSGRPSDKEALYSALVDMGLIPEKQQPINGSDLSVALALATQQFLAMTNSAIQLVPMEDALMLTEQVNIPGTIDEHPNWKRKLPCSLTAFWRNPIVQKLVDAMASQRASHTTQ